MRPLKLRDAQGFTVISPDEFLVGRPGSKYRFMVSAEPLEDGPQKIRPALYLVDPLGHVLTDPNGDFVGKPFLYVNRLLDARWVGGTRGLR